ncbi:hypothetical protein SCLCIDRAFT_1183881 [Scleroderma citrinum Foug A]|uniref:Uncharacterized protein n=1 Tax=Scleroderma citrinum Foug A TaxID=1036808 RepID=A0A0C3EK98_9AGAM|nr:hypothetical protein SCLCIDRAFT_1183881 [Scleroderma citrinum Foug A]
MSVCTYCTSKIGDGSTTLSNTYLSSEWLLQHITLFIRLTHSFAISDMDPPSQGSVGPYKDATRPSVGANGLKTIPDTPHYNMLVPSGRVHPVPPSVPNSLMSSRAGFPSQYQSLPPRNEPYRYDPDWPTLPPLRDSERQLSHPSTGVPAFEHRPSPHSRPSDPIVPQYPTVSVPTQSSSLQTSFKSNQAPAHAVSVTQLPSSLGYNDSDADELPDRIAPIAMAATMAPGSRPKPVGKRTGGEINGSAAGPVKHANKGTIATREAKVKVKTEPNVGAKKGHAVGAVGYSDNDVKTLLSLIKTHMPIGGDGWKTVACLHNNHLVDTGVLILGQLVSTKKPTGDAEKAAVLPIDDPELADEPSDEDEAKAEVIEISEEEGERKSLKASIKGTCGLCN